MSGGHDGFYIQYLMTTIYDTVNEDKFYWTDGTTEDDFTDWGTDEPSSRGGNAAAALHQNKIKRSDTAAKALCVLDLANYDADLTQAAANVKTLKDAQNGKVHSPTAALADEPCAVQAPTAPATTTPATTTPSTVTPAQPAAITLPPTATHLQFISTSVSGQITESQSSNYKSAIFREIQDDAAATNNCHSNDIIKVMPAQPSKITCAVRCFIYTTCQQFAFDEATSQCSLFSQSTTFLAAQSTLFACYLRK